MATKLGIELRKLRVERGDNLRNMAEKIGISISYLSAIENGARKTPDNLIESVCKAYGLDDEMKEKLIVSDQMEKDKLDISLMAMSDNQKNLVYTLSRKLSQISDDKCDDIMKILEDEK